MNTNRMTIHVPPARIDSESGKLRIYVDLPGVQPKDFELSFEQGLLTVRGGETQRFERQFQLGEELDPESITATLKHGVLSIEIGRRELARRIQVQAG
jgi:HSP20 family protein